MANKSATTGARPFASDEQGHLNPTAAHLVAASGEFVGTFLFLWLGYAGHIMAVNQASPPFPNGGIDNITVIIIAMAYGFPLLVNIWTFYRISGGLFNPAVRANDDG
jgi:aquaporin rerated protein, other eukaryote